jgi:dTMP kinase
MSLVDELFAFIEDRKQHVSEVIAPALARGQIVILDRYYYSTVAYQGARGADPWAVLEQMRSLFPAPDLTFILDLSPRVALARIQQSRGQTPNTFEQLEYLSAVRAIFLEIARREAGVNVVDADRAVEIIQAEIQKLVGRVMQ